MWLAGQLPAAEARFVRQQRMAENVFEASPRGRVVGDVV